MTEWMCVIFSKTDKICDNCRKEISILKENKDSNSDDNDQSFSLPTSVVLETLNMSLQGLEESPIQIFNLSNIQSEN